MLRALALGFVLAMVPVASGQIVITEWMYNGSGTGNIGEFVEFTNTATDGLYEGGTYSGGLGPTTFTTTGIVTNVSAP